jgi:hypothetical protein
MGYMQNKALQVVFQLATDLHWQICSIRMLMSCEVPCEATEGLRACRPTERCTLTGCTLCCRLGTLYIFVILSVPSVACVSQTNTSRGAPAVC